MLHIEYLKFLILALYKPTELELEKLGRSIGYINSAVNVTAGDKEYRLGQLAYALRHAIEAHHGWPNNPKIPYWTRVKLLRFLNTPDWENADQLGTNIAMSNILFKERIDSTNETLFEVIKKPLIVLGEIFLYSPNFKDSNLSKILAVIKGQNALSIMPLFF